MTTSAPARRPAARHRRQDVAAVASSAVRFTDVLCSRCQRATHAGGATLDLAPFYAGSSSLTQVFPCRRCRARAARAGWPRTKIHVLPDLTTTQRNEVDALHEASHAAVAFATGQPVRRIALLPERDQRRGPAGITLLEEPVRASPEAYAAICWAGQQATLRYLDHHGIDTPANRLDVRRLGWHDIRAADDNLRRARPRRDPARLLRRGRVDADAIIDSEWEVIVRLQHELLRDREVVFDQDSGHRQPPDGYGSLLDQSILEL